jgi:hypothetical protein
MSDLPGRSCPIRYQYGPQAIAKAPTRHTETLFVVGGLYGNGYALRAIQALAEHESASGVKVTICFNGDFNWFNVSEADFLNINQAVAQHDAITGNVEAELASDDLSAGCGCAYPENVSNEVVERSNRIFERLHRTALNHAPLRRQFALLPMFARYQVGNSQIAVVHGDFQSLAGWNFDVETLRDGARADELIQAFSTAKVDVFASSHTCLPAMKTFSRQALTQSQAHQSADSSGQQESPTRAAVINNGAAGMPNFQNTHFGVITRISRTPAKEHVLHSEQVGDVYVEAIKVDFDHRAWTQHFLENWPKGSDAYESYFERISRGPAFEQGQAYALR